MANQYINKVEYGGNTLIDLTADTITADKLYVGLTAHAADGSPIVGTLATAPLDTLYYDYNIGYIDNGTWRYENPTNTYTDIYEVQADRRYFITLGLNRGSRFRAMFTTQDVTTKTSGNVAGTGIVNTNSPASYANASFTTSADGYILVAKDNVGKTGIFTYVYDVTEAWI